MVWGMVLLFDRNMDVAHVKICSNSLRFECLMEIGRFAVMAALELESVSWHVRKCDCVSL
jgi:hypothetical protein